MQGARVEPNLITYNALIHACAQVRTAPQTARHLPSYSRRAIAALARMRLSTACGAHEEG